MKFKRRIIGFDPGLARFGWAVVEPGRTVDALVAAGCITTSGRQPDDRRLLSLHHELSALLQRYRPAAVAMEKLFFTKNVSSGLAVGQARGVALLTAAAHRLPIVEFTPTAVKHTVTGDGRADKQQIQRMVKLLLRPSIAPANDDTTDAMAIALCGLHGYRP